MPKAGCRLAVSESPDEEFQGPNGDWFSIHRSIVLDGWLAWRHALPELPFPTPISADHACQITGLAQRIHAVHMGFPEYGRLMDSPFRVGRWWDPAAKDEWRTGRKVLLRVDSYSASHLAKRFCPRFGIKLQTKSENWVEISLADHIYCKVHSLDYDTVVTTVS